MTEGLKAQPGIDEIELYQGGESRIEGRSDVVKLSSNENPYGTSEAARTALARTVHTLHRYPSTDHAALRAAIAEVHGLSPERIICGAGSDEILAFICQAYAGVGDEVLYTRHGFSLYKVLARAAGAVPVAVDETERRVDVDKVLAAVTDRTKIVFVTNPGNPTGTMLEQSEIAPLVDALPASVLLVLDGAYAEYAEGFDGGAGFVDGRDNVVMTRTFSKIYGLGGLRIGWAYGSQAVIDTLNRVRGPFNLSETQLVTAAAAMRDRKWVETCRTDNARLRNWLREALLGLGVHVDESHANFVLARFVDETEALGCDRVLREDGILVRRVAGYGFPEALRITVGTEADCRRVVASVTRFREGRV